MASWGYAESNGPKTWSKSFPAAAGARQSPINIETKKAVYNKDFTAKPLTISYLPEKDMNICNTGASMKADVASESTMTGGPLGNNVYKLIQFHLHWGAQDDRGAEHLIDGKCYSSELHLVHWNSTAYKSFAEAVDKSDGLAVLCMFIKVGNKHPGFDQVSNVLCKASCKDAQCKLAGDFNPSSLLPNNTQKYWTYPGSLTTPPCYESVQFILFEETLEFSADQIKALRSMHFDGETSPCMMDNYRPVVDIGSRVVEVSFQ